MSATILLIDDDDELLDLLSDYLTDEGFAVERAADGAVGIAKIIENDVDLVVLDITMPGVDGIAVLKRMRTFSTTPVIMLTARGDDDDRVQGLELGADDYVPKPCTPRELAARIRAILKRSTSSNIAGQALVVGALSIWPAQRRVECAGKSLHLTSTEFNLVEVLARNAGQIVRKDALSQEALGRPLARFDRSVDVHVASIRHKLGNLADGRSRIQTVVRKGYMLVGE